MLLTNYEIYTYAEGLRDAFEDKNQYLPIKLSFFIQKNKETLFKLAQDIEKSRMDIIQNYGTIDEKTNQVFVPNENISAVNKELVDLFDITQEVDIKTISIDSFSEDLSLTNGQMQAIVFMID